MPKSIFLLLLLLCSANLYGQGLTALHPGITTDSVLRPMNEASRLAYDDVTGHLWYTTVPGQVVEVFQPSGSPATETLRYDAADHGITFLQNILFHNGDIYLSGNNWGNPSTVGFIKKGTRQADGSHVWTTLMSTEPYPQASPFADHGFSGMVLDTSGTHLLVTSGSRTALGEVRDNNGAWPGVREVPLTTRMFRIPLNVQNLVLPNDSSLLDNGPYVYAWGLRNTYDLAWSPDGHLFGVENCGERDDPEELNWIKENAHYGFPWTMGGNQNPLQNPNYQVGQDPLVNPLSGGASNGYFAPDPNFPAPPNLVFTEPIQNFGPDADKFRDPITGNVRDASDEGGSIPSFTAHRSPLGLVFDTGNILDADFRGDAFMVSFMPGGDSSGFTPLSPWGSPSVFVDPSDDLLHLELQYDSQADAYTMHATRVVEGFYKAVDAEMVGNTIYVIENGFGTQHLWKVEMPLANTAAPEMTMDLPVVVAPNPTQGELVFRLPRSRGGETALRIFGLDGRELVYQENWNLGAGEVELKVDLSELAVGTYTYQLQQRERMGSGKIALVR